MVALPAYSLPHMDIIQRRVDAKRAAQQRLDYRTPRGTPIMSYPLTPWLLHQERLYREQVMKAQPPAPKPQPVVYHVYHFKHGELPHNHLGDLLWKAVSFIGSFFDAWSAAHA